MKILDLRQEGIFPGDLQASRALLAERPGAVITVMHPSALSFATSMVIGSEVKKSGGEVTAVIVDRLKDAVGAVSARKLGGKFAIIYCVSETEPDDAPRSVPTEIENGIDCWVFPSEAILKAYAGRNIKLRVAEVVQPIFITDTLPHHDPETPLRISWIGPVTDSRRLMDAIDAMAKFPDGTFRLDVYGTGKAGRVMPAVKEAKHCSNFETVWHGDDYKLENALRATDVLLAKSAVPDGTEALALASGIPVIDSDTVDWTKLGELKAAAIDPDKETDKMYEIIRRYHK